MEEILSSIKNTVEKESSKVEETKVSDMPTEEVLDLTEVVEEESAENAGVASAPAEGEGGAEDNAPVEDLIDIEKFAQTGEAAPLDEVKAEESRKAYDENAEGEASVGAVEESSSTDSDDVSDVDLDALMAEIEGGDAPVAAPEVAEEPASETAEEVSSDAGDIDIDALMAETAAPEASVEVAETSEPANEEPATDDVDIDAMLAGGEEMAEEPVEESYEAEAVSKPAKKSAAAKAKKVKTEGMSPVNAAVAEIKQRVNLKTAPAPTGLQVAFPSEVLAEALRPLVIDWVEENLQDIVEKLVKEELAKLVEK